MKILIIILLVLFTSCGKDKSSKSDNGIVSGVVTDAKGQPLKDAKIIVDHSVFFNSNLSTLTNSKGEYSLKIKNGSWYAFAIYKKDYHQKLYQFYLHPHQEAGFGGEGAVRNFKWQLSGAKAYPLSGYYGGLVTIDHYPGVYIDAQQIIFTFTPQGNLIDGSVGQPLVLSATDGYQLKDLPIGRYNVVATYNGSRLKLRKWNTNDVFSQELVFDFEPQIDGQCDNCFKIEYNQ